MQVSFDGGNSFYTASTTNYSVDITLDGTTGPTYFEAGFYWQMTLFVLNVWGYAIYNDFISDVSVNEVPVRCTVCYGGSCI